MIDADVRPPHKTLYEVLVVPATTPSRQIRKIARALRHNLPNLSDLDDVCLAEQVLGNRELRTEYDALLARAGAAKLTLPQIGPAIEGTRPASAPAPAPAPPPAPIPAPFSQVGRGSADSSGDAFKLLLRVAVAAVALIGAVVGKGSKHDTDHYRMPDFQPIQLHDFDPPKIEIPRIDLHELGVDKVDSGLGADRPSFPKLDPGASELDRVEALKRQIEELRRARLKSTAAKPRGNNPDPLSTP